MGLSISRLPKRWRIALLVFIPALILIRDIGRVEGREVKMAVFTSHQGKPFEETLSGLQQTVRHQGIQGNYELFFLEGDAGKMPPAIRKAKAKGTQLAFTFGTPATEGLLKEEAEVPVIASLILRADILKKASNATGIILEFPVETQLKWIRQFLPHITTIGVIYNPKENQGTVEKATALAERMGLRLETQRVQVPQDLPGALEKIARNGDVLWGIPDSIVYTPQTAKHILLNSFRNKIPLIGLSSSWVKAGALYSLDWDYGDVGAQCGETALKILQGMRPGAIPPAGPRKALYSINLNTARHMKIEIPEAILRNAQSTY